MGSSTFSFCFDGNNGKNTNLFVLLWLSQLNSATSNIVHNILSPLISHSQFLLMINIGPYSGWPLFRLALNPVGPYSGSANNELALIPLALSPVGLYSRLTENGLALIPLALSPVGLYSVFAENGLALIHVALFPVALSPVGPYSGWPLVWFTIFTALALIPLALSPRPRKMSNVPKNY
jgi:hypothetical protein